MLREIMGHSSSIVRNWPLIWELAKTQFKLRYAGSILGFVWAILQPLLLFLILLFVFSLTFHGSIPYYSLHLLTGIIVWTYFAEGTRVGLNAFLSQTHLLKNVALPRQALLFAAILNVTITFAINLLILAVFYAAQGIIPTAAAIGYALLLSVGTAAFMLGISFIIGPLHVLFRDLGQIWEVVLTLGFYGAPIIYSLEFIPAKLRWVLWFNPVGYIIHFQREALLFERYASVPALLLLCLITAATLLAGFCVYSQLKNRMTDYL